MNFLTNLFEEKKVLLQDDELGNLYVDNVEGNKVIWQGEIDFLGCLTPLKINGSRTQLNICEKKLLLKVLHQPWVAERAVEQYFGAGSKTYCRSIYTNATEIRMSFADKHSSRTTSISLIEYDFMNPAQKTFTPQPNAIAV